MNLDSAKIFAELSQTKELNPIISNKVSKIIEKYNNKSTVNKTQLELTLDLKVESHQQFVVLSKNALTCSLESLMYAIQENLVTTVQVLMKQDEELRNKQDSNKNTPIHFALKLGREAIANLLIENPAKLDLKDCEGNSLLHLAAQSNLHKIFVNLKPRYKKKKIFEKNMHGDNCIHEALKSGSNEIFTFIETFGNIDYKVLGSNNNTYLHFAAIGDCDENVLNTLISNTVDINCLNSFQHTPLHEALLNGSAKAARVLCDNGSDINLVGICNENCFHFAAQGNCYEMIDILSEKSENTSINARSSLGLTPLHVALAESTIETVKMLIKKNVDLNSLDLKGNSIFHYIAKHNLKDLIKYLDSTSPQLCLQNKSGYTPLHISIKNNSYEVFLFLIQHDSSSIDSYCFKTKNTPLHTAAILGNVSYVYGLLLNGAKVNVRNDNGNTPIQLALKHNNQACVEILLLYAKNIHEYFCNDGHGILHYATHCSPIIIKKILNANKKVSLHDHNTSLEAKKDTLYHTAIKNKNLEVVKFLVSQKVTQIPDSAEVTPLELAGSYGNAKIFKTLIDELNVESIMGKNKKIKKLHVLEHIIRSGNKESYDNLKERLELLEKPLDLSQLKDKYVLRNAIEKCHLDMLHTLLSNEVLKEEIDQLDPHGLAPLHYAVRFGNLEAVKCLISFGCNKDVPAKLNCKTPLHEAVTRNKIEILKYLIQIGVNINARDKRGYTAIHYAVVYGNKDILIYLIKAHANTKLCTCTLNYSPLLLATALNRVNMMEYLIQCDENMYTAIDYDTIDFRQKALDMGSPDALEFIENYEGPNYNIIKSLSEDVEEIL